MAYFKNVNTLGELRKQYKELLKKFHPDNENGSVEITQEINSEYDRLFKVLKDKHEKQTSTDNTQSNFSKKHCDFTEDKILREMLQKVIHFDGITIDIVGCYIWIDGTTYPYRNELKEIGFKWNGYRKKWFWTNGETKRHRNSKMSYVDIQNKYGSTEVKTKSLRLLKQA